MNGLIRSENLSVGYDGKSLIRDIGIDLKPGEILTLIGPNGSGKSTILKTLSGFLSSIGGSVYIGGRELSAMSGKELAKQLSVMLTTRLSSELMTCEDVVATGRYPYTGRLGILSEEDKAIVAETMKLIDIEKLKDRDFSQISDGQRQRVMLARAFCQQPRVIVLDEPTSYLDVRYELELLSILREMSSRRGIAVVMSLHELDLAERISDKVMCVRGETIYAYGTPNEIFTEQLITGLYGISEGSYNPRFGSLEMPRAKGEAEIFVIAGGGSGIPVYRALQRAGIPFASGVLHASDVDCEIAKALASVLITEAAFSPISEQTLSRAAAEMEKCRYIVNCLQSYGEGNMRNRELAEYGISLGLTEIKAEDIINGCRRKKDYESAENVEEAYENYFQPREINV